MVRKWALAAGVILSLAVLVLSLNSGKAHAAGNENTLLSLLQAFFIDNMEDKNNQIIPQLNRYGYWYDYVDTTGSTITPAPRMAFLMSPNGGDAPSFLGKYSAQISGTRKSMGWAGMGFHFCTDKKTYDVTFGNTNLFTMVCFYAKANHMVRFTMPDKDTDPLGGVCDKCYDHFGTWINMTNNWTLYSVPFSTLQQEGWGGWDSMHSPTAFDPKHVFGCQWQFGTMGDSDGTYNYSLAVDNVMLL